MCFDDATIYQIYPLGLCGAPLQNDGSDQTGEHRILRVLDWVEHIKKLGATCVLFNPLFDSDAHGYDTRDYNKVDCRLGTNDDLRQVCAALHAADDPRLHSRNASGLLSDLRGGIQRPHAAFRPHFRTFVVTQRAA